MWLVIASGKAVLRLAEADPVERPANLSDWDPPGSTSFGFETRRARKLQAARRTSLATPPCALRVQKELAQSILPMAAPPRSHESTDWVISLLAGVRRAALPTNRAAPAQATSAPIFA